MGGDSGQSEAEGGRTSQDPAQQSAHRLEQQSAEGNGDSVGGRETGRPADERAGKSDEQGSDDPAAPVRREELAAPVSPEENTESEESSESDGSFSFSDIGDGIAYAEIQYSENSSLQAGDAYSFMVYDSLPRQDGIVVLTSETDKDGFPIVASIRQNGAGRYELESADSNFLTGICCRDNFEKHMQSGNLLCCGKNKSQELFSVLGLQSSEGLNNLDYDIIIHQSRNIVNRENAEEIPTVSEIKPAGNFYLPAGEKIEYASGEKAKYRDNITAIRTLKNIEKEKRTAAFEEQKLLDKALESDRLLFVDKNKSQEMFERWGEQYSELTNTLDYNTIIHQSRNIVNREMAFEIQQSSID